MFYDLPRLTPGDTVSVRRADGSTADFVVTGLQTVEKNSFPTESVYAPTPTPQLRLVTWPGVGPASGHYVDNLVVTAVAVYRGLGRMRAVARNVIVARVNTNAPGRSTGALPRGGQPTGVASAAASSSSVATS